MKILIVDDHILFRESLVSVLRAQPGITIVGDVGTGKEAVERALTLKPELVLMDVELPDFDGLEAMRIILSQQPTVKIIILTIHDSDDLLFSAISGGAKGFILKNTPIANFIASLQAVERGEAALSREMTSRLLNKFTSSTITTDNQRSLLNDLTSREMDILRLYSQDKTNDQIAEQLVISKNTVKVHISHILKKLNLQSRRDLSRFTQQIGMKKGL